MTLPELQSLINHDCEILKIAEGKQRERTLQRLSGYLRMKREWERIAQVTNNLCTGYPQDK
jgi:hypothetical protein